MKVPNEEPVSSREAKTTCTETKYANFFMGLFFALNS